MKKVFSLQFIVYSLIAIGLLIQLTPVIAVGEPCVLESDANKAEATGLASAPITGNIKVNINGQKICVENERAAFVSYKLPTYEDLKSIYFTQSKASKTFIGEQTNQGNLTEAINQGYQIVNTTNLGLNGDMTAGSPFVVFVDRNLLFDTNFTYGNNGAGMVFVVKGDVNIEKGVTRLDGVIIAEGTICTAYDKSITSCAPAKITTSQLLINGSLISLNSNNPPKLMRTLTDNNQPAEKIVWQSKYQVILKDLFSDTYQKWSEIQ